MASFVSLGMVVVDELRIPGQPPLLDVPGGSGAFSTLGARLVAGREQAADVGCFILAGQDFPSSVLDRLRQWNISLEVQVDPQRPSTRGLLTYHDDSFGHKSFCYTTTPLQPTPRDLPPSLLGAAAFHLLASPAGLEAQVADLARLRPASSTQQQPLLVWEPLPLTIDATACAAHLSAGRLVDVFSPNHIELAALMGETMTETDFSRRAVEKHAAACLDSWRESGAADKTVVVRAGGHGCLVSSLSSPSRSIENHWLPAYAFASPSAVVDATGAGNTFLGALTFAMASRGLDAVEAAKHATVAASFVIEQIGMATLDGERWNGETFAARFRQYEEQLLSLL